jgi:uncharacterized protein
MEVLCRLSYSGGSAMITTMVRRLAIVTVALALVACSRPAPAATPSSPTPYHSLVVFRTSTGHEPRLRVAVATTDADKRHGLMGVRSLPDDAGMAFVWTSPTTSAFWMKDTLIPLQVAFVDARDRVVSISDMTPCATDPCRLYRSDTPYTMAVEANAGWFDRHGVRAGDTARLGNTA